MISDVQALAKALASCPAPSGQTETVALTSALGRILGERIESKWPLPPHSVSAMDGYAVRAADLHAAASEKRTWLTLAPAHFAGDPAPRELASGETMPITTGGQIPPNADAVVRQEDIEITDNTVGFPYKVESGRNIRYQGTDMPTGTLIADRGERIEAHHIGALAAFGHTQIHVHKKPRVAILANGNELLDAGKADGTATVDSNSYLLHALVETSGAAPEMFGIVEDDLESLTASVAASLKNADMLLMIAGASKGAKDFASQAVSNNGGAIIFHGVRHKPGKPVGLAKIDSKLIWMLPGNPGAASMCFEQLVKPTLQSIGGFRHDIGDSVEATGYLTQPYEKRAGMTHYLWGKATRHGSKLRVDVVRAQGSGSLFSAFEHNCIVTVPPETITAGPSDPLPVRVLSPIPLAPMPYVLGVAGWSNSGKTTLLRSLIERLQVDLRVSVIKHGHHPPSMVGTKDSDRFAQSGAQSSHYVGPQEQLIYVRTGTDTDLQSAIERIEQPADIVLVEGYKHNPNLPKLQIIRAGRQGETLVGTIAIASDDPEVVGAQAQGDPITRLRLGQAGDEQSIGVIEKWIRSQLKAFRPQ